MVVAQHKDRFEHGQGFLAYFTMFDFTSDNIFPECCPMFFCPSAWQTPVAFIDVPYFVWHRYFKLFVHARGF